jgi:hypothetical protein
MNIPTRNPDDNDPAGISDALRRDARRIGEAPFDAALQRETMARIREIAESRQPRFRWSLVSTLATASAAVAGILFISFLFKPAGHPAEKPAVEIAELRLAAPRASVLSYERALAQGDAAFAAALDRDAQSLLPASAKLPDGLL